jgi:hypothetical protein
VEFVFTGFHQEENIRRYAFQGIGEDRKKADYTVGVDMVTVRRYGIPLQELPLLCRRLLEERERRKPALTFTEEDMLGYASFRAARQLEAERKRTMARRPVPSRQTGKAWR